MKKQLLSILLMCLLVIPLTSTLLYLNFHKTQIRKEVKKQIISGLNNSDLKLIELHKSDLNQLNWKHSKEFEFQSEMYDIVDTKESDDSVFFWCWWDNKETKLNKKLDLILNLVFGSDSNKESSKDHLISFFKSLYLELEETSVVHQLSIQLNPIFSYLNTYSSISFPPKSPPPALG